jgi:hypothetical protein
MYKKEEAVEFASNALKIAPKLKPAAGPAKNVNAAAAMDIRLQKLEMIKAG